MNYRMYCVYDAATDSYTEPFISANDTSAFRGFETQVVNTDIMKRNKADFTLYCIGSYNVKTGILVSFEKIRLASGTDVFTE